MPRDAPSRPPSIQRWLTLAFAAVVSSFLAATAYSQYWVARIDVPATAIATNASPSIEALAGARADLSELQIRVFTQLRALEEGRGFDASGVDAAMRSLRADIARYSSQPVFPGESALADRVRGGAGELESVVLRVEAAAGSGDVASARDLATTELRRSVEVTGEALHETTKFNARNAADLAVSIERVRQRSMDVTIALNLVCAIAAVAAALVVWRVVRAYREVVESRNDLLARRAEELDAFGSRVAHDLLNPLNTIRMSVELIEKRTADPTLASLAGRAVGSVDRAAQVVRDLLGFAKAGAAPEIGGCARVRDAIEEVADELSVEAKIAGVTLSADPIPDCAVACTKGVLVSVLSNLTRNAIKYIGEGPRREVTLRVRAHCLASART
jgi:signal transduction histidine kinase